MTANDDLDQQLYSFLREGPTELPYQSFDAVRDRTEQTRQRALIGPWRTPNMNRSVAIGLGAAAVVVIGVFLGARLLGPATTGAPVVTSTPTPTPTAASTATAAPSAPADGSLKVGSTHLLVDHTNGQTDTCCLGMKIKVTIPAAGWFGDLQEGVLVKDNNPDAPDGAGLIVFANVNDLLVGLGDVYVYGDPCHWESTKPDMPVTTVDEAIAALASQTSRDASAPEDVTLDGYQGKRITLHVPDDAVFSDCDGGEFRTLIEGEDSARYHQDPGQIDLLWVLDVNGELAIFDVGYYEGTPQSVLDEVAAIVESATIVYTP